MNGLKVTLNLAFKYFFMRLWDHSNICSFLSKNWQSSAELQTLARRKSMVGKKRRKKSAELPTVSTYIFGNM